MMTIRRAVPGDLRTVLAILHSVQGWLRERGIDQWPDGSPSLGPVRIGSQIERGEFWIVSEDRNPVAVIALSPLGDPDFWSPAELADRAVYISKAAVLRRAAGRGIGAMLLRWAVDRAASEGALSARLDVWKTNAGLQDYYRRQGWHWHGTVEAEGRNSGALFCRKAKPDPEAWEAFTPVEPPVVVLGANPVVAGMPVIVATDDGPVSALCTKVAADWSHGVTAAGWEQSVSGPPPLYEVERDGASWLAREVWADPAMALAETEA